MYRSLFTALFLLFLLSCEKRSLKGSYVQLKLSQSKLFSKVEFFSKPEHLEESFAPEVFRFFLQASNKCLQSRRKGIFVIKASFLQRKPGNGFFFIIGKTSSVSDCLVRYFDSHPLSLQGDFKVPVKLFFQVFLKEPK
jgi:hypothetical protein